MEEKFDYAKAVAELEEIAARVEDPATKLEDIDALVNRSNVLLKDCRAYLRSVKEKIDRIVKEEVTKLDVWGKHPRYQKEPMTTPANKEVLAGTADRDFNDDSAKGDQPYGRKIGSSAPFDDKVVDLLTDQVMNKIREMSKN